MVSIIIKFWNMFEYLFHLNKVYPYIYIYIVAMHGHLTSMLYIEHSFFPI